MQDKSKVLYIIAAGLSTRMNGLPKHLCEIDGKSNIERTLQLASKHYDKIFIALNVNASKDSIEKTVEISLKHSKSSVITIASGLGDTDAVNRALKQTYDRNTMAQTISICWGDTVYMSDEIFKISSSACIQNRDDIIYNAFCSKDDNPYAWFEIDEQKRIVRSTYRDSIAQSTDIKYHDQSLFNVNVEKFFENFNCYEHEIIEKQKELQIEIDRKYSSLFKLPLKYEITWIKIIQWNIDRGNEKSIVTIVDESSKAFNTLDELDSICKSLND